MIKIGNEVPLGVKILSVLHYISGAMAILGLIVLGVIALFFQALLGGILSSLGTFGWGLIAAVVLVYILLVILEFAVGYGLWNAKNWARIVVVIFSILGILGGAFTIWGAYYFSLGNIFNLGEPIASIIVGVVIVSYLLFNQNVKNAFSR